MKLTLKIKPRAMFALKTLVEDELNNNLDSIARYDGIDEKDLDEWTKDRLKECKRQADLMDELQTALVEALDNMVTWLE